MGTLTRKQREIHEREVKLMAVARQVLIEHGFAGLSMDRLAEITEYSKGTLYQHFSTKEDLVAALAIESMERRIELFHRAVQFAGHPREKLLAVGVADELFSRLHPQHYRSEFVIQLARLKERASPERREALDRLDQLCFQPLVAIAHEAVARRELFLPSPAAVNSLVYAVITLVLGTQLSMLSDCSIAQSLGIADPLLTLRENLHTLLDGFGWRPFRAEWDYDHTCHRIQNEIFHAEFAALASR